MALPIVKIQCFTCIISYLANRWLILIKIDFSKVTLCVSYYVPPSSPTHITIAKLASVNNIKIYLGSGTFNIVHPFVFLDTEIWVFSPLSKWFKRIVVLLFFSACGDRIILRKYFEASGIL